MDRFHFSSHSYDGTTYEIMHVIYTIYERVWEGAQSNGTLHNCHSTAQFTKCHEHYDDDQIHSSIGRRGRKRERKYEENFHIEALRLFFLCLARGGMLSYKLFSTVLLFMLKRPNRTSFVPLLTLSQRGEVNHNHTAIVVVVFIVIVVKKGSPIMKNYTHTHSIHWSYGELSSVQKVQKGFLFYACLCLLLFM